MVWALLYLADLNSGCCYPKMKLETQNQSTEKLPSTNEKLMAFIVLSSYYDLRFDMVT